MKILKKVFKPMYAWAILLAIGLVIVAKKAIFAFNIESQYKNVCKLNKAAQKMYALVFNPYRISNGIRPSFEGYHQSGMSDIEMCHQIIHQKRQEV